MRVEKVPAPWLRRRQKLAASVAAAGIVWVGVGAYSGFATFRGFERLNWGLMAVIVTVISQLGAMVYQFPLRHAYERREGLRSIAAAVPFLVLGLVFHAVSFAGSIYYHREASLVSMGKEKIPEYERQGYLIRQLAEFNLSRPASELSRLRRLYLRKQEEEERGEGITGQKDYGQFARSYELLARATDSALAAIGNSAPVPEIRFQGDMSNEEAFRLLEAWYSNLPTDAFRMASGDAFRTLEEWRAAAPRPADPEEARELGGLEPKTLNITIADAEVRKHLDRFPYQEIPSPALILGQPDAVLGSISNIIKDFRSTDPLKASSSQAGLLGAGLTEFLMILANVVLLGFVDRFQKAPMFDKLGNFVALLARRRGGRIEASRVILREIHDGWLSGLPLKDVGGEVVLCLGEDIESAVPQGKHRAPLRSLIAHCIRAGVVRKSEACGFVLGVAEWEDWLLSLPANSLWEDQVDPLEAYIQGVSLGTTVPFGNDSTTAAPAGEVRGGSEISPDATPS